MPDVSVDELERIAFESGAPIRVHPVTGSATVTRDGVTYRSQLPRVGGVR